MKKNIKNETIVYRYKTDPNLGLDDSQVEERLDAGLTNEKAADDTNYTAKIIRKNIFTYFNLIFFVFAAILISQGSYNHLTFLGVVFTNTIIGIVQEIRSKRTLDKLSLVSAPISCVVRCGKEQKIPSDRLVLDDIIVLETGNQIPADAVVCSGEIFVNESLITGEADEIKKSAGGKLLSGSFVVSGKCRARLEAVGAEAFASKLTDEAKKAKKRGRPGMMRSLNILIMIIGIIIIPFFVIMFFNQHNTLGLTVKESIENSVASSIGMIPEGLYLLTSIALAASTVRLAKGETLVHDMKCIESLARVDIICVDKTGTITKPDMEVNEIIALDKEKNYDSLLKQYVSCMETENITLSAVKNYFGISGVNKSNLHRKKEFSSAYKYSAAEFSDGRVYALGAPEILLGKSYNDYRNDIETHFSSGERILLFGEAGSNKDEIFSDGTFGGKIQPLMFITLSNPIRENACETFKYFSEQGVCVKVISGDNPESVSAVAARAGIENAEKYIDVSGLSEKEILSKEMLDYTVFGRVKPEQKRLLIKNFKKAKHTVAMTGDGVNDVLALKDADCSIAMASGSDAAANVSDLVLVNSDFANMPKVVAEGRRVINNIERTASLFLVKNIFSFFMTVISIFAVSYYPLKPVQISLVSCTMIGIPSFFLALEPNKSIVRGRFLRNVLRNAFPAAVTGVILVECSLLLSNAFKIEYAKISTVACMVYAVVSYIMLYKTCKPFNVWHSILFAAMGIIYILFTALFPEFFNISKLDFGCIIIMILLFVPAYPLQKGFERIFDLCRSKVIK